MIAKIRTCPSDTIPSVGTVVVGEMAAYSSNGVFAADDGIPAVPPEDHEIGDLADDVADIYRDLSAGLALVDAGHALEAQWELRFSFLTHWGRHASGAIRALHCWYVDAYDF